MQWEDVCEKFDLISKMDVQAREKELTLLKVTDPKAHKLLTQVFLASTSTNNLLENPLADQITTLQEGSNTPIVPLDVGQIIGDFEIDAYLGQGASAIVYKALQKSLRRPVAIKVSHHSNSEAQILAKFDHPNIVKIYSQENINDYAVTNLQFIDGQPLNKIIDKLKNSDSQALVKFNANNLVNFMKQLLTALSYAHEKNILHLDIKPSNILVRNDGQAFLADFGISMERIRPPQEFIKGGTRRYMSKEQEASLYRTEPYAPVTVKSDLYSLSLVFSELLENIDPEDIEAHPCLDKIRKLNTINLNEDPSSRMGSAQDFIDGIYQLEFKSKYKKLVSPGKPFESFLLNWPLFSIISCCLFPQIFGSFFNIFYNDSQIVSHLTEQQSRGFTQVTILYNAIVYPFATTFFFWNLRPLLSVLKAKGELSTKIRTMTVAKRQALRSNLLRLPKFLFLTATMGWIPGSLLYARGISWFSGQSLSTPEHTHLFLSFFISWLIAACFGHIILQYICVGLLYPHFIGLGDNPIALARKEIYPKVRGQFVFLMAGILPLISGIVFINFTKDLNPLTIRLITSYILIIGIFGMVLGIIASQRFNRLKSFLD